MRRHELDPVSLVFGFAFTAAGALFLAGRVDQAVRLRWLWPLLLLALGLGILLDLNTRRSKPPADTAEPEPPATEPLAVRLADAERPEAEPVAAEPPEREPAEPEPPVEAGRPGEAGPVAAEEASRTGELGPEAAPPEPEPERDR
jgi:hypothetical protein